MCQTYINYICNGKLECSSNGGGKQLNVRPFGSFWCVQTLITKWFLPGCEEISPALGTTRCLTHILTPKLTKRHGINLARQVNSNYGAESLMNLATHGLQFERPRAAFCCRVCCRAFQKQKFWQRAPSKPLAHPQPTRDNHRRNQKKTSAARCAQQFLMLGVQNSGFGGFKRVWGLRVS